MGGNKWEQRSLIRIFRYIDPMWLYPLMDIWIIGYLCFCPDRRRAIWHYHRLRLHQSRWQSFWGMLRNYNEFGKALLDRFACWGGRRMRIVVEGKKLWEQYLMNEQPFVILGSHLGNLELAGYTIQMPQKVFALVYTGDSETVEHNRRRLFEQMGLTIIPIQKDGGHVLDMHRAIEEGHVVSVHGDRMFFYMRAMRERLLGAEASFPAGCFLFAAMENVPVLSLFVMREGKGQYRVIVKQLDKGESSKPHRVQAQALLKSYASVMEDVLLRYPNQWFNFYEFWS